MDEGALGGRPTVIRGSVPARPHVRSIEEGRRVVREALSLLESIPPRMAEQLRDEIWRSAKWRADINLALVLDALALDERPRPKLTLVQ